MNVPDAPAIPSNLATAAQVDGRQAWLATVPTTIRRLETAWSVTVGAPFQPGGQTAWVAPARRGDADLVVKVLWRHPEAEHEADALVAWDGNGSVRLHAACDIDSETIALLLERCRPGTALATLPEPDQDHVVAGLLRRLWIDPPRGHRFRSLASMCARWADRSAQRKTPGVDRGLGRAALAVLRELPLTAGREVLLATDLHAENVLAAEREPWLLIDPKPYVGDPTYDVVQHLLNCQRLHTDPGGLVRRLAELLELDPDRLALWVFARCVQESPAWPGLADVARELAP
jgi:streptomycin 6-kinase